MVKLSERPGFEYSFHFGKNFLFVILHLCRATGPRMPPHMPCARDGGVQWSGGRDWVGPCARVFVSSRQRGRKQWHGDPKGGAYGREPPSIPAPRRCPTPGHYAIYHTLLPSGRSGQPFTRRYHGSRHHVFRRLEVRRGSSEVYRGYPPPRREEEAGES